jgi:hypothetical protein
MRFGGGWLIDKTRGDKIDHVCGFYLDIGPWTLLVSKADQWAKWVIDWFRCDE